MKKRKTQDALIGSLRGEHEVKKSKVQSEGPEKK